jgi:hypothetical protein
MKNKSKKNQLLFVKNTLTELTPDSLQKINGGEEGLTDWPPNKTQTITITRYGDH